MRQEVQLGKIPLLISDWEEFNQYKETIIDFCLVNEKPNTIESNIAINAKEGLWESSFDFLEKNQKLVELKLWIQQETETLVNQLNNSNYKFAITESWCHITRTNGFHRPHYHHNSTWSGIFYVDCDENSKGLNSWYLPYYIERKSGLEFADDKFTASFVPGRLILFPSCILHDADNYFSNKPRIVISFNGDCI